MNHGDTTRHTALGCTLARNAALHERTPTFAGAGAPGAVVTVTDPAGTALCITRVTGNGCSCPSSRARGDGLAGVIVAQDAWGQTTVASKEFTEAGAADAQADVFSLETAAVSVGFLLLLSAVVAVVIGTRIRAARRRNTEGEHPTPQHETGRSPEMQAARRGR